MNNIIRLLTIIAIVFSVQIANAAQFSKIFKLNCYPELGYIEISTNTFDGAQEFMLSNPDKIYKKYGIYPISKLLTYKKIDSDDETPPILYFKKSKEFIDSCKIGDTTYDITINIHVGDKILNHKCGGVQSPQVTIKARNSATLGYKTILKDFIFKTCDRKQDYNYMRINVQKEYRTISVFGEKFDMFSF